MRCDERELRERQHALHQLARRLHGALRPAELLRAERADTSSGSSAGETTSSR